MNTEALFSALLRRDPRVTRTAVAAHVQHLLSTSPLTVAPNYVRWYYDVINRWLRHLLHYDTFPDLSPAENRARLMILLREDLSIPLGPREPLLKSRWRHLLPQP